MESSSREQFRLSCLESICRALALDGGALNHTRDGVHINVESFGFDAVSLRRALPGYMAEVSVAEMQRTMVGNFLKHDDVLAQARRARLRLYTEYLAPRGISSFCVRSWINRHGLFWVTFMREGRSARYSESELDALDVFFSAISLGEALHVTDPEPPCGKEAFVWLFAQGVSRDELRTVDLWYRGFAANEIAMLLGRSTDLIRCDIDRVLAKTKLSLPRELRGALTAASSGSPAAGASTLVTLLAGSGASSRSGKGGSEFLAARGPSGHSLVPAHPGCTDGAGAERSPGRPGAPRPALTRSESAVLQLLALGFDYAEIGTRTGTTINTVRTHVRAIYKKLGASNRAEAVNQAWVTGLLASPPP